MDTKRDMNVALFCDLDDAHYLQCALMLNSAYSDVIMTVTGDENNSDFKGINSCNTRSAVNHEDKLNFTADELLNLKSIITQNFSISSTCPSDNVIISTLLPSCQFLKC